MKAARRNRHMPRLHKFFNDDDKDGRERRLRAETRVQRRRLALETSGSNQCQEECPIDNTTCNCEQLFNCIKRMSVYDAAVLFADGYIITDFNDENFGSFTTDDLNLYDVANGGLYEKFLAIQQYTDGPANDDTCTKLLMEMHKPCDSTSTTCSHTNLQSYQLTVDQVCDGVNTDTKLNFEAIFDAYSLKPNCLLITTDQGAFSEGTLEVSVDSGYGYVKVTPSETKFFSPNEIVVDECFASIEGVQVSNPTTNGWTGYIELSSGNKKSYRSMICGYNCACDTCTSNCNCDSDCISQGKCSDDSKTMVVVDGDNDNNYSAKMKCLDGKTCTFHPSETNIGNRKFSCVDFLLFT